NALFIVRLVQDHRILFYLLVVGMILCVLVLIQAIFVSLRQATTLQLCRGKLVLHDRIIQAKELRMVMTRGYFKPMVGLLPHGKHIVPMSMVFRFAADEDRAISDLTEWAVSNQVEMCEKRFRSWI